MATTLLGNREKNAGLGVEKGYKMRCPKCNAEMSLCDVCNPPHRICDGGVDVVNSTAKGCGESEVCMAKEKNYEC